MTLVINVSLVFKFSGILWYSHIIEIRNKGLKIGSTTGYTSDMMKIVTDRAKQQGYTPDFWISPDMVNSKGRPYPYMIFRNMEALELISVDKVLKVGDTIADIKEGVIAYLQDLGGKFSTQTNNNSQPQATSSINWDEHFKTL